MDLYRIIRILHDEKKRLDRLIGALEAMRKFPHPEPKRQPQRRGRKGMSAAERSLVSERMKQYWARRRDAQPG